MASLTAHSISLSSSDTLITENLLNPPIPSEQSQLSGSRTTPNRHYRLLNLSSRVELVTRLISRLIPLSSVQIRWNEDVNQRRNKIRWEFRWPALHWMERRGNQDRRRRNGAGEERDGRVKPSFEDDDRFVLVDDPAELLRDNRGATATAASLKSPK
ncbi:hypothetical protein L1887_37993 [Cichorium endivia]|nr:hypothetical protein L1887_37993 [Cichorium endivia]